MFRREPVAAANRHLAVRTGERGDSAPANADVARTRAPVGVVFRVAPGATLVAADAIRALRPLRPGVALRTLRPGRPEGRLRAPGAIQPLASTRRAGGEAHP